MQNAIEELAERVFAIASKHNSENPLQTRIEIGNFNLRLGVGAWINMDNIDVAFTILPLEYIMSKTFGIYK